MHFLLSMNKSLNKEELTNYEKENIEKEEEIRKAIKQRHFRMQHNVLYNGFKH